MKSDDSYYDEVEEYEFAAINEAEIQEKRAETNTNLNEAATKVVMQRKLQQDSVKMQVIFEVADLLSAKHLPDHKIGFLKNFMQNFPAFKGHF